MKADLRSEGNEKSKSYDLLLIRINVLRDICSRAYT